MPGAEIGSQETKLRTSNERTIALAGRQVPIVVLIGVAALAASWVGIAYFA